MLSSLKVKLHPANLTTADNCGPVPPARFKEWSIRNPVTLVINAFTGLIRTIGGAVRSKYIEIILAVALFVLLDAGVLMLNFYTSYQIANDAHAIQLASRMGTLSQSLLHQLYQVQEDARNADADYFKTIDTFADTFKTFDETLDAFIYGGELIGVGQGQDALLKDTAYRDTSSHLLKDAEEIWKTYRSRLTPIVYAYFNDTGREEIVETTETAISYARQHSDTLLELMQSFALAVEGVAQRKAERLRLIQSIGISLAVINFFLILFHFLKRLRRSDTMIEQSRKETEDILANVDEGLFLLDRDYRIGHKHSQSLHALFEDEQLAGRNFIDLLRPLVTEKTLATVEDYTEILFSPRVNESLIADLNPLKQVEINLSTELGGFDIRYFSFQFSRVTEKRRFNALLVTVKDITKQVQLGEQLKAANEMAGKQIDMMLGIIHLEGTVLTDFLQTTEKGLTEVNDILKGPSKDSESLKNKAETIFRIIHKLKGDSTSLGLEFVEDKFHRLEAVIAALKERRKLSGEDFLPLVVHLKQLLADFTVIRYLQKKMNEADISGGGALPNEPTAMSAPATAAASPQNITFGEQFVKQMQSLVNRVARDFEKQATLDMSEFDGSLLSETQREPVRDIIVQSLRNAIAHGLEPPLLRSSNGKPQAGNIAVGLSKNGQGLQLTIRDDGQGIDLEKIKATAIASGLATERQLSRWDRTRILSMIFLQGFTTAPQSNVHAGHGVGMDLIKARLDSLKGQARVRYQPGKYTEFQYNFDTPEATVQ